MIVCVFPPFSLLFLLLFFNLKRTPHQRLRYLDNNMPLDGSHYCYLTNLYVSMIAIRCGLDEQLTTARSVCECDVTRSSIYSNSLSSFGKLVDWWSFHRILIERLVLPDNTNRITLPNGIHVNTIIWYKFNPAYEFWNKRNSRDEKYQQFYQVESCSIECCTLFVLFPLPLGIVCL